jgi:hypothetical protein
MPESGNGKDSWRLTRAAHLLGIDYPILMAPFGGLPSQRLTAAVSNLGGLGSLGAVTRVRQLSPTSSVRLAASPASPSRSISGFQLPIARPRTSVQTVSKKRFVSSGNTMPNWALKLHLQSKPRSKASRHRRTQPSMPVLRRSASFTEFHRWRY